MPLTITKNIELNKNINDKLKLVEIFTHEPIRVFQGEGKFIGLNTILIRFGLCNLRCNFCDISANWYADTTYTIEQLLMYPGIKESNLLFTGGEPLINEYRQIFIKTLLEEINNDDIIVEIETNGINSVTIDYLKERCHFNISPKENRYQLENITIQEYKLLRQLNELKSYIVKFVYDNTTKNKEFILDIIYEYNIPKKNVYIMPEGATKSKLEKNIFKAIDFAMEYGFNISPRLHILLDIAKYVGEPENIDIIKNKR